MNTSYNLPMRDVVMQEGPWEFTEEVATVFEDMLERSIPDYEKMREAACAIAAPALARGTDPVCLSRVLDLGCSNGIALQRLDAYALANGHTIDRLVGLDISEPMLARAREIEDERYWFLYQDLCEHLPFPNDCFDVVLAVLTIQFCPVAHRQRILDEASRVLRPGGRLVLVEKVLGATQGIDDDMIDIYHDHKRDMGYTDEQIERKRLNLEGVMSPVTPEWNEVQLDAAGFLEVDCFWRWMNFAGWIAIR